MPPVPFLTRNVINSETINGYKLNHGSLIIIPIYNYHRLNSNWEKPNIFFPDRWINNNKQNDIFIPFASGPKQCIGNRLSYLEMEIILSEIYKNIKLIKFNNNIISTNPFITLRPNEDIIMKIETVH